MTQYTQDQKLNIKSNPGELVEKIASLDFAKISLTNNNIFVTPKKINDTNISMDLLKDSLNLAIKIDINPFFNDKSFSDSWRSKFPSLSLVIDTITFKYFINDCKNSNIDIDKVYNQRTDLINLTKESIYKIINNMEVTLDEKSSIKKIIENTEIKILGDKDPLNSFGSIKSKDFQFKDPKEDNMFANILKARKLDCKLKNSENINTKKILRSHSNGLLSYGAYSSYKEENAVVISPFFLMGALFDGGTETDQICNFTTTLGHELGHQIAHRYYLNHLSNFIIHNPQILDSAKEEVKKALKNNENNEKNSSKLITSLIVNEDDFKSIINKDKLPEVVDQRDFEKQANMILNYFDEISFKASNGDIDNIKMYGIALLSEVYADLFGLQTTINLDKNLDKGNIFKCFAKQVYGQSKVTELDYPPSPHRVNAILNLLPEYVDWAKTQNESK